MHRLLGPAPAAAAVTGDHHLVSTIGASHASVLTGCASHFPRRLATGSLPLPRSDPSALRDAGGVAVAAAQCCPASRSGIRCMLGRVEGGASSSSSRMGSSSRCGSSTASPRSPSSCCASRSPTCTARTAAGATPWCRDSSCCASAGMTALHDRGRRDGSGVARIRARSPCSRSSRRGSRCTSCGGGSCPRRLQSVEQAAVAVLVDRAEKDPARVGIDGGVAVVAVGASRVLRRGPEPVAVRIPVVRVVAVRVDAVVPIIRGADVDIGVGVSSQSVPPQLSESSPSKSRS